MITIAREPYEFTPKVAWLRRLIKVTRRRGQVWSRSDRAGEIVIVIGNPEPLEGWRYESGLVMCFVNFVNACASLSSRNWCHQVLCLETGRCYRLDEMLFLESERGLPSAVWRRIT